MNYLYLAILILSSAVLIGIVFWVSLKAYDKWLERHDEYRND